MSDRCLLCQARAPSDFYRLPVSGPAPTVYICPACQERIQNEARKDRT